MAKTLLAARCTPTARLVTALSPHPACIYACSSIYSQNAFQWYCYFLQYTSQPWRDCSIPTLPLL